MARLAAGSRLGRYVIVRPLGQGAMGEVYLAEDPQIGRQLALKMVRVEEGRAHEIEERKLRLLREARAAGRLLHPNIVTLFDAGEDQGVLYLAFEFVEGTDLSDRIRAGPPLSLGEALSIVRQAAEALDFAHRQGVVHRDIKPSNLMLTRTGQVKVADFGIAKVADQTSDLTMTGSVVGSPHYLSPEQIRGEELDGRSDIFSLGVLLYEILCHRRPFEGETLTTLVYQILHQEPASLVVARPDLGARVEHLVRRMLHKDRDQRFATAADVAREVAICERELAPALLAAEAAPETELLEATRRLAGARPPAVAPGTAATAAMARTAPVADSAPPQAPAGSAAAGGSRRVVLAVAAAAVLLVAAVLGLYLFGGFGSRGAKSPPAVPSDGATATPHPLPTATPATEGRDREAEAAPLVQPEGTPPTPAPTPFATPEPEIPAPTATPRPTPRPVEPVPTPVPTPIPTPEATPHVEPTAEPDDLDGPFDREMNTGMALSFDVEPDDAIVRVNRIVIGQAREWNAKKRDGRAYDLPRPGKHLIRIIKEGRVHVILIHASAGAPSPTHIAVDLEPGARKPRRRGGG